MAVTRAGIQCTRLANFDSERCSVHSVPLKANREEARARNAMAKFVAGYEGELNPVTAFEAEFRRCYGRILWLEARIAELEPQDLIWGEISVEVIGAAEFTGTNTKYGAQIHQYEEMLRWERTHLLKMETIWIRANLDEKKLSMMRDHISYTYTMVIAAAKALGHNPEDEGVRATLKALFTRGDHDDAAQLTSEPFAAALDRR